MGIICGERLKDDNKAIIDTKDVSNILINIFLSATALWKLHPHKKL